MPVDDPSAPPGAHAQEAASLDGILSVNDRGRRQGNGIGPFMAFGAIALVMAIGLLLTVNTVKKRFGGPQPAKTASTALSAGLARTFNVEHPPALPGDVSQAGFNGPCADGSVGSELRTEAGVIVRDGLGQVMRMCSDGQVAGMGDEMVASSAPIPVETSGPLRGNSGSHGLITLRRSGVDGQIMLNDATQGAPSLRDDVSSPSPPPTDIGAMGRSMSAHEGLSSPSPANSLGAQLTASNTPLVQAARIGNLSFILPKGRTIDCGLSTRIVSSLAGQADCILTRNVYSADGKVVLLERGSEAVGEYRSAVNIGQRRLFVLWTRIVTPTGIVIDLDSPGADELGATGLRGSVDNHFFDRVGSAFLLSSVQDVIAYEVAQEQARAGQATVIVSSAAQAGSALSSRVLDSTINIPPTLFKSQGDRAIIYVARDLDFSNVYRLKPRS